MPCDLFVPEADLNHCEGFYDEGPLLSDAVDIRRGHGSMALVELLLDNGVDLNGRDVYGLTALHVACRFNNILAAQYLLRRGIDVNSVDKVGLTPFALATSPPMIHLLLKHGADIHMRGANTTCIHRAILRRDRHALLHFLAFGVSTEELDQDGISPLELCRATEAGVLLVAAGANPNRFWKRFLQVQDYADEVALVRRQMADIRNSFIRDIALPICIGLQPLELPAFVTVCIIDAALEPRPIWFRFTSNGR